jgi:hypothetical protein
MISVPGCAGGMPLCGSETKAAESAIGFVETIDDFGAHGLARGSQ